MPGEFHLSIKNTQRKIVDVRDLFKDLTKEELEILEKAKLRSEEEKRLKDFRENENYYMSQKESKYKKKHESNLVTYSSKPSLQDMDKSTSASDLLVTSAYVDEKEANLIRSIKIRDSNRQQVIQKHRSMMFIPNEEEENQMFSKATQMNRYLSHIDVNELPKETYLNYMPHYNIIQKVSIKKPPKPKTVSKDKTSSQNYTENSSISTDSSNSSYLNRHYVKNKVSSNPPRSPPQMSIPKAKMTRCCDDEYNRRYFNGFKNKMKTFLEVDKKFKFRSTHVNSANQRPSTTNQRPSSTNQRPSSTNQIPSSTNQIPSSTNQIPSSTNLRPNSAHQRIYTSDQINYQRQSPPMQTYFVTNLSEKTIRPPSFHSNEIYAYEPTVPMFYNYNSNGSINNLINASVPPHPNLRQHCSSHNAQRYQPHQYFNVEQPRQDPLKYQNSSNQNHFKRTSPPADRITAFFNRTKNFRF